MSHGITEVDRGIVWGDTWHKLPQYLTVDRPVTYREAFEVLNFPLEKRQLLRRMGAPFESNFKKANAWEIVRSDTNDVLVPYVGSKFEVIGNEKLLEHINDTVLKEFPQLQIESVGTLWKGATTFVNLKVNDFNIPGDSSKTLNRIMWWNPLGKGSYRTCAHNIRVVCANTLTAASRVDSDSQTKIAHTKSGAVKVAAALDKIARHFLELEGLQKTLKQLATVTMQIDEPAAFLKRFLPIPGNLEKEDPIAAEGTSQFKFRNQILNQFQQANNMSFQLAQSRYAMLQAVTYSYDHERLTPSKDRGMVAWDGIVGNRAQKKAEALELLSTVDKFTL
jgi:hypothetical protein